MDDFARNLRLACSQHRSISEVCRRIGINRQQFNKYLSGQIRPSRHNLAKITDFLGLGESDLFSEHGQFSVLLHERRQRSMGDSRLKLRFGYLDEVYQRSAERLQKYLGDYFTYFHSLASPGLVTKSFIRLFEDEGRVYSKGIEIIREPEDRMTETHMFKYLGSVAYLNGAIYIREHETLAKGTISQTTLMPSYHNRVSLLSGLTLGMPSGQGRLPACSRIIFQKLDPGSDLKEALRCCGRYYPDDAQIPARIADLIRNEVATPHDPLYADGRL